MAVRAFPPNGKLLVVYINSYILVKRALASLVRTSPRSACVADSNTGQNPPTGSWPAGVLRARSTWEFTESEINLTLPSTMAALAPVG